MKYVAPVTNGRQVLLGVRLPGSFYFARRSFRTATKRIQLFHEFTPQQLFEFFENRACFAEDGESVYFLEAKALRENRRNKADGCRGTASLVDKACEVMELIRLYTGACVGITDHYFMIREDSSSYVADTAELDLGVWYPPEEWTLPLGQRESLSDFLAGTSLPLPQPYLDLAQKSFDLSFHLTNTQMAFISLVTALEALFNDGGGEVRYKIARGAALVLSHGETDFERTFRSTQDYYDLRSKLVHRGISELASLQDVHDVRRTVRDLILALLNLNLPKQELSRYLTRHGCRP